MAPKYGIWWLVSQTARQTFKPNIFLISDQWGTNLWISQTKLQELHSCYRYQVLCIQARPGLECQSYFTLCIALRAQSPGKPFRFPVVTSFSRRFKASLSRKAKTTSEISSDVFKGRIKDLSVAIFFLWGFMKRPVERQRHFNARL